MSLISPLLDLLHSNPILGTSAAMTIGGGLLYSLKSVPMQLFQFAKRKTYDQLVYTVTINEFNDLYPLFEKWLAKTHPKKYRNVMATIVDRNNPMEEGRKRTPVVVYDQAPNTMLLKINGRYIMVVKHAEKVDNARSFREKFGYKYTLSGFNCRKEIEAFLQSLVDDEWASRNINQVRIFSHNKWGDWSNMGPLSVKGIDAVIIDPQLKRNLIDDLNNFKSLEDWYRSVDIPYKRTYAFDGPPGTGKTTLAKAIAMYSDRDLYYLNPSTLDGDSSLQNAFRQIGENAVLIIEDIDSIFNDRVGDDQVTFSGMLNCLDGVYYKHGLITCITTNHIDRIDPAMLRPGRTDVKLHIGYPAVSQIIEYLDRFYSPLTHYINDRPNNKIPMAEVQEICIGSRNDSAAALEEIIHRLNKQ